MRVYPRGPDPNQSYSQITFYSHEIMQAAAWEDADVVEQTAVERAQAFANIIRDEDYWVAASAHKGALSGAQDHVTFGRNEPGATPLSQHLPRSAQHGASGAHRSQSQPERTLD